MLDMDWTVVAPTPISVAKECVSNASPVCALIDVYPLNFFFDKMGIYCNQHLKALVLQLFLQKHFYHLKLIV